jgi:LPXTG-motif cell wall-anchored protein
MKDGKEIKYYVSEITESCAQYYWADAQGNKVNTAVEASGSPLTADIYNMPIKDIVVKKAWIGDEGYQGGTDSITATLLANGAAYRTGRITKTGDGEAWTYRFKDLPVFDANGNKINYTVKEETVFADYNEPVYSEEDGVLVIKNEMTGLSLNLEKKWAGDNEAKRPDSVKVRILSSVDTESTVTSVFDRIRSVVTGQEANWHEYKTVEITKADGWKTTVTGLPRYTKSGSKVVPVIYAVEEIDVPAGYKAVTNVDGSKATIINTGNTSVAGFKVWDDKSNAAGYRPGYEEFAEQIVLKQDGVKYLTGTDKDHFRWIKTTGDSWGFEFYDLPVGFTYTVDEASTIPGYNKESVDDKTNTITNSLKYTELTVTKKWDDENNAYVSRPSEVSFRLLAVGTKVTVPGVTPVISLGNEDGASYTWKNLPVTDKKGKPITYSVEEVSVPSGYTASVKGSGTSYTITNRFRPENTSVSVRKVWDDLSDTDKIRPSSIQVALTRNGEDIETVTLSESNNWSHTWSDLTTMLPDGSGTAARYSVREVSQILGYSVSVGGSGTSYVITNYHRPPSTPDTPPTTPDTPPTTPDEPGTPTTPDTPSTPERSTTPTQQPYNIPDEPTPLAGLSQVLGARRAAANSVLGARRSPKTGDASNAAAFAAAMASAGAMMGAWFAMRRKKKA